MFSTDTSTRDWPSLNTRRSKFTRRNEWAAPVGETGLTTRRSSRTNGPASQTSVDAAAGSVAV